jgi:hypothetical protein
VLRSSGVPRTCQIQCTGCDYINIILNIYCPRITVGFEDNRETGCNVLWGYGGRCWAPVVSGMGRLSRGIFLELERLGWAETIRGNASTLLI